MQNSLKLEWYPLSANWRTDNVNEIVRQSSDLNDNYLSLGTITLEDENGFYIQRKVGREMPYPNSFQNAITYELSQTQRHHFRQVYSLLDFLADIGGFLSAIGSLCLIIVTVF